MGRGRLGFVFALRCGAAAGTGEGARGKGRASALLFGPGGAETSILWCALTIDVPAPFVPFLPRPVAPIFVNRVVGLGLRFMSVL